MEPHTFTPCQDPLACTVSAVSLCHSVVDEQHDCQLPEDDPIHSPLVIDMEVVEDDMAMALRSTSADLEAPYLEAARSAVDAWADGLNPAHEAALLRLQLAIVLAVWAQEKYQED